MSDEASPDHDHRLKVLLKEFFGQFFEMFFPEWAERFDFTSVEWLDKEVFLSPPQGEKRQLDLVAKMRLKPGAPPPWEGTEELVALVHVEVERRKSAAGLRPRMFEYYVQLRRDLQLPVLPIGLLLQVGLDGIGWDAHEERFWEHRILKFDYAYVGLPGLDAEKYLTGEHVLGAALSSMMRVSPEMRAELHAEGLQRIARCGENDFRQHLLAECLEAYSQLDDEQKEQFRKLLEAEQYQEAKLMMTNTIDQARYAERRAFFLAQLEAKFGELAPAVRQRVEEMSPEELWRAGIEYGKAESLRDLGLED